MMNTTRRGFLKVFGFLGALLTGGSKLSAAHPKKFSGPLNSLDAEAMDVAPLPCAPAIDWEKDNQYVHDLAHGGLTWDGEGSTLLDRKGNRVDKGTILGGRDYHSWEEYQEQLPSDHHERWLEHGEQTVIDCLKNINLTTEEQITRASQWAKPAVTA